MERSYCHASSLARKFFEDFPDHEAMPLDGLSPQQQAAWQEWVAPLLDLSLDCQEAGSGGGAPGPGSDAASTVGGSGAAGVAGSRAAAPGSRAAAPGSSTAAAAAQQACVSAVLRLSRAFSVEGPGEGISQWPGGRSGSVEAATAGGGTAAQAGGAQLYTLLRGVADYVQSPFALCLLDTAVALTLAPLVQPASPPAAAALTPAAAAAAQRDATPSPAGFGAGGGAATGTGASSAGAGAGITGACTLLASLGAVSTSAQAALVQEELRRRLVEAGLGSMAPPLPLTPPQQPAAAAALLPCLGGACSSAGGRAGGGLFAPFAHRVWAARQQQQQQAASSGAAGYPPRSKQLGRLLGAATSHQLPSLLGLDSEGGVVLTGPLALQAVELCSYRPPPSSSGSSTSSTGAASAAEQLWRRCGSSSPAGDGGGGSSPVCLAADLALVGQSSVGAAAEVVRGCVEQALSRHAHQQQPLAVDGPGEQPQQQQQQQQAGSSRQQPLLLLMQDQLLVLLPAPGANAPGPAAASSAAAAERWLALRFWLQVWPDAERLLLAAAAAAAGEAPGASGEDGSSSSGGITAAGDLAVAFDGERLLALPRCHSAFAGREQLLQPLPTAPATAPGNISSSSSEGGSSLGVVRSALVRTRDGWASLAPLPAGVRHTAGAAARALLQRDVRALRGTALMAGSGAAAANAAGAAGASALELASPTAWLAAADVAALLGTVWGSSVLPALLDAWGHNCIAVGAAAGSAGDASSSSSSDGNGNGEEDCLWRASALVLQHAWRVASAAGSSGATLASTASARLGLCCSARAEIHATAALAGVQGSRQGVASHLRQLTTGLAAVRGGLQHKQVGVEEDAVLLREPWKLVGLLQQAAADGGGSGSGAASSSGAGGRPGSGAAALRQLQRLRHVHGWRWLEVPQQRQPLPEQQQGVQQWREDQERLRAGRLPPEFLDAVHARVVVCGAPVPPCPVVV